jgi:hypothetical protein
MRDTVELAAHDIVDSGYHDEVMKNYALEAYLLHDLTEEEKARFEEHYFSCTDCADAVAAGQTFVKNIRRLEPMRQVWWQHPAAAMAALLLVAVYVQQFAINSLAAPHANTVIVARERVKGSEPAYALRTPSATVELNVPGELEFPFYRLTIAGGLNRTFLQVVPAPAGNSDRRLSVQISRRALGSGHFAVRVEGLDGEASKNGHAFNEEYEFDLR